jgi:hypothetical protein
MERLQNFNICSEASTLRVQTASILLGSNGNQSPAPSPQAPAPVPEQRDQQRRKLSYLVHFK